MNELNWLGQPKEPPVRDRPEGWAYQEFPENPRDWMQEMLAEQRQMQTNMARGARYIKYLSITLGVIAVLLLLDFLDHHG